MPIAEPWTAPFWGQLAIKLVWGIAASQVIRYDWVVVYFLATQSPMVKPLWDVIVTVLRRFLRAGMESELTSASGWVIVANPYSVRHKERHGFAKFVYGLFVPNWLLTLLEHLGMPSPRTYGPDTRLKWGQWPLGLMALPIAAIPGYTLGIGIYFLAVWISHTFGIHPHFDYSSYPQLAQQIIGQFTAQWQYSLAGLLGTLFYARLVFKVYACELVEALARQAVALHLRAVATHHRKWAWLFGVHVLQPVGYRAAWYKARSNPSRVNWLVVGFLALLALLAILAIPFGYVILSFVAKHRLVIPGFGTD